MTTEIDRLREELAWYAEQYDEQAAIIARIDGEREQLLTTLARTTAILMQVPDLSATDLPPEERNIMGMARLVVARLARAEQTKETT